ncbi:hypothetical protein B2G50_07040 [Leptospira interrogans serovar Canicola]|nr:hypothetical protein B2G50_07040 [Leptospira interrogans serovar Canicola]
MDLKSIFRQFFDWFCFVESKNKFLIKQNSVQIPTFLEYKNRSKVSIFLSFVSKFFRLLEK